MTKANDTTQLLLNTYNNPWHLVSKQINKLINQYHIVLNFHDLVGLSFHHTQSQQICSPYLFHNNSFCNRIKSEPKRLTTCIEQKNHLIQVMKKRPEPLYGTCPEGFSEYVLPLLNNGDLIGLLCIGNPPTIDEPEVLHAFLQESFLLKALLENIYVDFSNHHKFELLPNDVTPKTQHMVYIAKEFIQKHYQHPLSLELVASQVPCNASYLSSQFKKVYPGGFSHYINYIRLQSALFHLKSSTLSITEIALNCGFQDISYFSKTFKKIVGISPNAYRKG